MTPSSRREFLQTSAVILAAALTGDVLNEKKKKRRLAFSTLGCPDWTFPQIADFAVNNNYDGIEVRGIQRQMDLTKCNEFNTPQSRKATLHLMKDKGLRFANLGSSANMHIADITERTKNMDEAKRFIDLAQDIKCPYVRVFPNKFPEDQSRDATIELITRGLIELGEYAKGSDVSVLMETHGDVVRTDDLVRIMGPATHKHTGLVWDISNMWTVTKESPTEMYKQLKSWIRHTHIKDAMLVNNVPQYTLLGKGEVPIFEAIDVLAKNNYKGYYSFEWEKMWHPEIAEPEVAIADYSRAMKEHFK